MFSSWHCFSMQLTLAVTWVMLLTMDIVQGDLQSPNKNKYVPAPPGTHPPCAKGVATFCEKVDKYPSFEMNDLRIIKMMRLMRLELIQSLLRSTSSLDVSNTFTDEREGLQEPPAHILHQESMRYPPPKSKRKTRSAVVSVRKKVPTSSKVDKRCRAVAKTVEPKIAMNHQGEWRYILDGLRFEVEVCNNKCHIPCTQEFNAVPMMSLSKNGKRLVEDKFFLPTSCKC